MSFNRLFNIDLSSYIFDVTYYMYKNVLDLVSIRSTLSNNLKTFKLFVTWSSDMHVYREVASKGKARGHECSWLNGHGPLC